MLNMDYKCLKCEHIPCVDFLREREDLEGGELFLLNQIIKKEKILPCIPGYLIYILCKLWLALESYHFNPTLIVLPQCIKDLKCSLILAFCGHQRNAIQVLRPIVENFLISLYFENKFWRTNSTKEFGNWIEGGLVEIPSDDKEIIYPDEKRKRKLDYSFALDYLVKFGWLTNKLRDRINKEIIKPLNKYLHPHFEKFEYSDDYKQCIGCFSDAVHDEKRFTEWLSLFQCINVLILGSLINLFGYEELEKNEEFMEALKGLADPYYNEIVETFIVNPQFKDFISSIQQKYHAECEERQNTSQT